MLRSTLGGMLALAACTGSGYDTDVDAEAAPVRVSGVLFVERIQGYATPDVQVGARFLRITGLPDEVLPDLVGTPAVPRVGTCVERGNRAAGMAAETPRAQVRLLDVGAIDVHAGQLALRMQPRRFPDLWNVVSGVLYGMEGDLPLGRWSFTVQGDRAAGVGGFEVEAQAPEELASVRLGEASLAGVPGATVTLRRGRTLPVRWAPGVADDRVAVVFEGAGTVVCGARDEGQLDVDAATMDRVAELSRSGGTVSVHRVRARGFVAAGLDSGALVFDVSVRARLRVE